MRNKGRKSKWGSPCRVGCHPLNAILLYLKYRFLKLYTGQIKEHGQSYGQCVPPSFLFTVSDAKLARFLLTLPATVIKKSGVTDQVWAHENGFFNNLFVTDGEKWQKDRKVLNRLFHTEALETYVEAMDESALTFVNLLSKSKKSKVYQIKSISNLGI